jgi:diphthine synthase
MLTFVGLGLWNEQSVTAAGEAAIAAADRVFAEFYTSRLGGASVADLERYHDTSFELRDRAGVEEDPDPILTAATVGDAVFCTAGDTMIATTHVDLRLRAQERGIDTRVIQGTTAASAAAALSGLQNYRFGKATTLPFQYGSSAVPQSVLETIEANSDRGLHTLVFLDIKADEDRYMTADNAAGLLEETLGERLAIVICRAGSPSPAIVGDSLGELKAADFGDPLHILILPANLHHIERQAVSALTGAPDTMLD